MTARARLIPARQTATVETHVPVDLSADRLRDPVRALLARCFRRVGLSRSRLTDDHVLRAARTAMLRNPGARWAADHAEGAIPPRRAAEQSRRKESG